MVNEEDIASSCKWSPFTDHNFPATVVHTIVNGNHVVENGKIIDETAGMALTFDR